MIAPCSKLRVAVIGVGYLGRFHAQKYAALAECELVAVVDTSAEVGARWLGELGTRAVSDYRELIGKVDAVSIATPTASHFEIAHSFLDAGVHVLVEKPITESVEQAQRLIATARRAGRVLQVGGLGASIRRSSRPNRNCARRASLGATGWPRFANAARMSTWCSI